MAEGGNRQGTPAPACNQYLEPIIIDLKSRTRKEARVQVPVLRTAFEFLGCLCACVKGDVC